MTATDDRPAPTFPPCPAWCQVTHPDHLTGGDDAERTRDGRWVRQHDGGGYPVVPMDPGAAELAWGGETVLGLGVEVDITLLADGHLTAANARQLAAYLLDAADAVEAAQR
jgi:hypothetical protein